MGERKKDYEVGYGKPPKHGQFKKGQSGNPKGRPKGSKSLRTRLLEELDRKIIVSEGGERRLVSKKHAIILRIVDAALKGDRHAIRMIAAADQAEALLAEAAGASDGDRRDGDVDVVDREILNHFRDLARSGEWGDDPEEDRS